MQGEVRTSYPLMFAVDDLGEEFGLTAQIEKRVEARRVCGYMHRALESLVQELEREAGGRAVRLEVLPEAERRQVVEEWNATAMEFSGCGSVVELFEEQVKKGPDRIAVVCGEEAVSYEELNRRANQWARYLGRQGVGAEERVGLCMERSLELVMSLLATWKAGGAYVPLDPGYPRERLQEMVEDSRPAVVLTQRGELGWLEGLGVGKVVEVEGAEEWREEEGEDLETEVREKEGAQLAYVIYTSGSSGKAKGVMIEQRQIVNYVRAIGRKLGVEEGWRYGLVSTFAADLGNTVLFPALAEGGTLHVLSSEQTRDAGGFAGYGGTRRLDCIKMTPSHLQTLLMEAEEGEAAVPGQRLVLGGESLRGELVERVGELREQCRVYNHYGPSECTVGALSEEVRGGGREGGVVPLGRPLGNMRVYLMDEEGEPVPVGVRGELYIGGAGVGRGYLGKPELTAERFVPDRMQGAGEGGGRLYRSGDLGRWLEDGTIEFLGRNDFQVKVRGYRIELGEIEARLRECAGVGEAAVLAREVEGGEKRLVAYYSCVKGELVTEEQLREHFGAKLPEYMVPGGYVRLEKLPLTGNGKLDRRALAEVEMESGGRERGYEEPQGETETLIAGVWAEVLKLEKVGRHDNFFQLGGHSLTAVRVIARLRRSLKVELTIVDLFENPKLSAFAERVIDLQLEQFDSNKLADVLNLMRAATVS